MAATLAPTPRPAPMPSIHFPRGRWAALGALLTGQFMGLIDALIVNVTLPLMGRQLNASPVALQLVVGGYVAAYAVVLLIGARLGRTIGHRRTFTLGLLMFTTASLACGLAPTASVLVLFRIVQGAGAGLMIPQVMSLIQLGFSGADRARALSAYGVVLASGAAAGLLAGGFIAGADLFGLGWRPVFLLNVPLGVVLLILTRRFLPAAGPRGDRDQLDVGGGALGAVAVAVLFVALGIGPSLPDGMIWAVVGVPVGMLLIALFLAHQRGRMRDGRIALFNPDVLRLPGFRSGLLAMAAMQCAYGGFLFVYTLRLHNEAAASVTRTGLIYLALAVPFGVVGYYWRRLPAAYWPRLPTIGLLVSAAAYLALFTVPAGSPLALPVLAALGVGLGLSASPLLTQALKGVPAALVGDASAGLTTTIQLGQALGVAVFGTAYRTLVHSPTLMPLVGILLAICAVAGSVGCLHGTRQARERSGDLGVKPGGVAA